MVFLGNPESEGGVVDGFGERWKLWPGFNSDPENAGGFCGGEESVAVERDLDRFGLDPGKRTFDFFRRLNWLLAYEFQRDMQRFRTDPARVRGEPAHTFHEALNALADGIVDVEGNENAHLALSNQHLAFSAYPPLTH